MKLVIVIPVQGMMRFVTLGRLSYANHLKGIVWGRKGKV
jgi:hypothetical protein